MASRRQLLTYLAAVSVLGAVPASARAQARQAGLLTGNVCSLTPRSTEGPFYFDPALQRQDIREDRPGVPVQLRMQVVTADCRPIDGARVDIWHCDAQGNYSGYAHQGDLDTSGLTYLRGTQFADAQGVALFRTIWPGWYRGRATHIHFKVLLGDGSQRQALTGQFFFDERFNQAVYAQAVDYRRDLAQDTVNASDRIALRAGARAHAEVRQVRGGFEADIVIGVDPAA